MATGKRYSSVAVQGLVTTADGDATYGQPEADLINEIKADYNALAAAFNALVAEMKERGAMDQ